MTTNDKNEKRGYGYLCEHSNEVKELNPSNKIHKTGLNEYLKVIFPNTTDWMHNEIISNSNIDLTPNYRSDSLKLIIEFNGIDHYTNPARIKNDMEKEEFYTSLGYKAVMIPYFIQLTNKAVKTLFNVDVDEPLFNESIPSLYAKDECTPAFLCPTGLERMARDFVNFTEQYEVNMAQMKKEDLTLTRWDLLDREYNKLLIEKYKTKGLQTINQVDVSDDYKNLVINLKEICEKYLDELIKQSMDKDNINKEYKLHNEHLRIIIAALINKDVDEIQEINAYNLKLLFEFIDNIKNNDLSVRTLYSHAKNLQIVR